MREPIPPLPPGSPERYVHAYDANHTQGRHPEDPEATVEATDDHDRGVRSRPSTGHRGGPQAGWRIRCRFRGQAAVLHGDPARYDPGRALVTGDEVSIRHLRDWLTRGMTGCQFAKLIAQKRERIVAATFPGLASDIDVSRLFETGTDTHLPAIAVFTGIRTEAALIEQLSVLARAPRWRITREHPAGLI
ncbi:MAG: hypothetical protein E6J91_33340 [Deltaproteobacteria bacterium]|nr:MAG: hypothetical protein E6J91_33340 [Deltaproteobacteria bacterium]